MINVTRLDGREFTLNADLIEAVESHPDTYIRLVNGNSFLVRESRTEVVNRVIAYRQCVFQRTLSYAPQDIGIPVRAGTEPVR